MTACADTLVAQCHALVNAEAVLLVDDNERKLPEFHAFLEQRVRADDEGRAAACDGGQCFTARRRLLAAAQPRGFDAERPEPVGEISPMLFRQDFRGRHDRSLHAAGDGPEAGNRGDNGLARTDVTLDQTHHRVRPREIVEYLADDACLCARQGERQVVNKRVDLRLALRQRRRVFRRGQRAQVAEAQVVREQLLESETLLAGMPALLEPRDVGIGRRPVQIVYGIGERGHAQLLRY